GKRSGKTRPHAGVGFDRSGTVAPSYLPIIRGRRIQSADNGAGSFNSLPAPVASGVARGVDAVFVARGISAGSPLQSWNSRYSHSSSRRTAFCNRPGSGRKFDVQSPDCPIVVIAKIEI